LNSGITNIDNAVKGFGKREHCKHDEVERDMAEGKGRARTLYNTMQTKRLRGIRKKLMMVARISSGTYWLLIFIMLGKKMPTVNSKAQKANSCS
jgi:hypothetical protein